MNQINHAFEKLGIYDLVAVLLSGVCITTFSILISEHFWKEFYVEHLKFEDTAQFLIISYFVGVLFQEVGSLIQKRITQKNDKLLRSVVDTFEEENYFLSEEEKVGLYREVEKILKDPSPTALYNFCKFSELQAGSMARTDKDQSIAGMSRSLSLYFFLSSVCVAFCGNAESDLIFEGTSIMLVLGVLFCYRSRRFAKMRYAYILRLHYYASLLKNSELYSSDGRNF